MLAEVWGMPIWLCQEICPSSEFTLWKQWFALKWKKYDRESYEHGLTRQFMAASAGIKKELDECMLQKLLREPAKDWEWMTEDEQAEAIRRSKAAHGYRG